MAWTYIPGMTVDATQLTDHLPLLTSDRPGIGGVIRRTDDDFLVEELPLYEPCGEGTHVYFGLEKRGMTTHEAVNRIAQSLGRPPRDIGYAGLKDAHAVTVQTFSLEHIDPDRIQALRLPGIAVLWVNRHGNKLKLGHLRGNRFVIRIRNVAPDAEDRATEILEVLRKRGLPNYFGPQRFGVRGDTWRIGAAILRSDPEEALRITLGRPGDFDRGHVLRARQAFDAGNYDDAAEAWIRASRENAKVCRALAKAPGRFDKALRAVPLSLMKLYLNAAQSRLFNDVLARRLATIDRVMQGDVAWLHRNGACFVVEDANLEQPRCAGFDISPTGPMFGPRMRSAEGEPGRLEAEVLSASGLTAEDFNRRSAVRVDGGRRPLRVPLADADARLVTVDDDLALELRFSLPSGSYATCVIREVCKDVGASPVAEPED
ncbi:MAG: tRNA pseudouridine(13) synthase TruD [Planctomycetota bacterium]|nr:MAG: tRNA pseudouridine(13) synthase TruD [Planctomycetota bacterium]MCQ3919498.1 tRNA pseudouridine(13) synthase TruD [Planctomycetota bacterium]